MEEINIAWGKKPYTASWGTVVFKADAEKVAHEIESIGDKVTAQQIVDFAEDENTELHGCFEWDNDIAANRYRCVQARSIVSSLKITILHDDKPAEKTEIRYFVMPERKCGSYQKTEVVIQKPDEYQKLLANAKAELQAFKKKYKRLGELEEVFEAIDRL